MFLCTCLGVLYFQDRTDPEMCRNALLTHKQARRAIHPATRANQDSPTQSHTDTHTYTQTHLRAPGRQREEPAEPQRYLRGDRQTPCKKTNVTKPARIDGRTWETNSRACTYPVLNAIAKINADVRQRKRPTTLARPCPHDSTNTRTRCLHVERLCPRPDLLLSFRR